MKKIIGSDALNRWMKEKVTGGEKKKDWWVRIPKGWWFNDLKNLNPSERAVLITLKLYADQDGNAYPSLRTMAKNLNCNPHTVLKAVNGLVKKEYLEVVKRRGRFNSYKLKVSSVIG